LIDAGTIAPASVLDDDEADDDSRQSLEKFFLADGGEGGLRELAHCRATTPAWRTK
jgi:hypothetical protein